MFDYLVPQILCYSDASSSGCGALAHLCGDSASDSMDQELKFNYAWTDKDTGKSSTWRELKGVALALQAFAPKIENKCVKVYTDNKGVEAILQKGSMKLELQNLSVQIAAFCRAFRIKLQVQWVPRDENSEADALSREIDFDDWGVSHEFFSFMNQLWGPYSVDRFADNFNANLPIFNSKYWCPNTSHVDAFSVSWRYENNWLVPPITLIGRAVKHVRASSARATLVVPDWPSAPFWPLLFSKGSSLSRIVVQVIKFSDPRFIFVQGRNHRSIFGSTEFKNEVLCVRLDGSR